MNKNLLILFLGVAILAVVTEARRYHDEEDRGRGRYADEARGRGRYADEARRGRGRSRNRMADLDEEEEEQNDPCYGQSVCTSRPWGRRRR